MPVYTRSQSAIILNGIFITVKDLVIQSAKIMKMIDTSINSEEKKILFELLSITQKNLFEIQRDYPYEFNKIIKLMNESVIPILEMY